MSALILIAAQILLAALMIALTVALVAWSAWHLVYYIIGAKHPIGKTLILSAAALWVISAGIISMM